MKYCSSTQNLNLQVPATMCASVYRVTSKTWPCFSGTQKVTCPVYATVHVLTGQVTFSKVPEPCWTGHPVQGLLRGGDRRLRGHKAGPRSRHLLCTRYLKQKKMLAIFYSFPFCKFFFVIMFCWTKIGNKIDLKIMHVKWIIIIVSTISIISQNKSIS